MIKLISIEWGCKQQAIPTFSRMQASSQDTPEVESNHLHREGIQAVKPTEQS